MMNLDTVSVTIPNGGTEPADGVYIGDGKLVAVYLGDGLDGTSLSFKVCNEKSGTYLTARSTTADIALTVAASKAVMVDSLDIRSPWIKPVVGAQTGALVIELLVLRGF